MNTELGFIGGGNMAASLIGGLLSHGLYAPQQIIVSEPNVEKGQQLQTQFGVVLADDNAQLVTQCNNVVLAVKPQILKQVLSPLSAVFDKKPLLISIVAGITIDSIERWLNKPLAVVRIMPNTPALVGAGASAAYANQRVSQQQVALAEALMQAVGVASWVQDESDIDAITALSGSGPAYFMLFIQALVNASINAGIDADTAQSLAVATARGTARLIEQSDDSLQQLIANVTSPNGTTAAALHSFEQSDLSNIVSKAFNAAKSRSEQLADELS